MARGASATRKRPAKLSAGEFAKYHGLGNDYIVLDGHGRGAALTGRRVRAICERHTGVGADGVLLLVSSRRADFGLRIFNPDGSEAQKSGNGLRILARFLHDLGYTRERRFTIETKGGIVTAELLGRGRVDRVRLEMGRASFISSDIPMTGPLREVVNEALALDGRELRVTCVSLGNPHCVLFVPRLILEDLHRLGPRLEKHEMFPERANVQLACVRSRQRVEALVWERGAGETLASGTSSCAVAAAAFRNGLVDGEVEVAMRGGELHIEIHEDYEMHLTGTATPVFRGRLL